MPGDSVPSTVPRPLGLIPIGINEAVLDSPSFRASAQHMSDQADAIERWLEGSIRATSKMAQDFLAMEETINNYLARMVPPPGAADGVIDHDYTYLALKRAGEGARECWANIIGLMRRMENTAVEPVRTFLNADLRAFKEARRMLEQTQKTFDLSLGRYVGQSKTKEPSALREDAFAVYEARKAYLKASMDYCQLAPQLRFSLDKVLIKVNCAVWGEMRRLKDAPASMGKWGSEMDRVRGWSKEMEQSEGIFKRELHFARREVGENTLQTIKPSRELDDYSTSTVPFLGPGNVRRSGGLKLVVSEKQGWLFLRTMSGKPVRANWNRRWYYCRDGVFGWLIQGPQGVLQGDEIGVLLCNAKPAVAEDRRFCFEVKTGAQSMMLQAETQSELIEWLDVFDVARQRAFEATEARSAKLPGQVDPAFSVTAPGIPEFSARTLDATLNTLDDMATNMDRSNTLPVPTADVSRVSLDANSVGTRRTLAALGRDLVREEGESSRDHASRILQNFHRKAGLGTNSDGLGAAGLSLANMISASHSLLPTHPVPSFSQNSSSRPTFPAIPGVDAMPGSLAPTTLAKPPVPTFLSRNAVVVTAEKGLSYEKSDSLLASLMANYWGSNVWGGISSPSAIAAAAAATLPLDDGDPIGVVVDEGGKTGGKDSPRGAHGAETFPPGYPSALKAQHAQFRILFPKVPLEEKLVLVFRAAWAVRPNARDKKDADVANNGDSDGGNKEELQSSISGRVFITTDCMYFYGYHLGMVTTSAVSLDSITEVTTKSGPDCDVLYLHMRQDSGNTIDTRLITIKTFLDDFYLLIMRLNALIDDLQSEEPMDLQDLVAMLANMEANDGCKRSPSVESWEEVSAATPFDDGTHGGRPAPHPSFGSPGPRHGLSVQQQGKVALPTQPVIFEPDDMGSAVSDRHFEISAKACFHVLFGDKSFVFPKLYFERRAQQITQGPWESQENGNLQRDFRFTVDSPGMLSRSGRSEVVDLQEIQVFNDHVTYVVTHTKTAWHLPHSSLLKVVFKIVITHVAKSKCKLAIHVRIDWTKNPKFSKWLVEKQALDDASAEAEELAEVATDQVRKLGPHSRTKRAIQVYGHVGQQAQSIMFSPAEAKPRAKKQAVKMRTLTAMIFDTLRSFAESVVTSVIMWAFAALKNIFQVLTAHRLVLLGLIISILANVFISSKESWGWWTERRAAKFMGRLGVNPNTIMSKAIYLTDLNEATGSSAHPLSVPAYPTSDSICFTTFQALANSTDLDAPADGAGSALALSSASSQAAARRLRRARQRLGGYRHDLVVAMRLVNSIEREVVRSEWENWLGDENVRCERLRVTLEGSDAKSKGRTQGAEEPVTEKETLVEDLRDWYAEYCGSCRTDMKDLSEDKTTGMF